MKSQFEKWRFFVGYFAPNLEAEELCGDLERNCRLY